MFDLASRQKLNRGYHDGFTRAMEIVLTPLLFGLAGRAVDGWLGTDPVFMLGFGALAVVGLFVKIWLGYDREMRAHEARLGKGPS